MSRFINSAPDGATHFLHSEYADIYLYYKHDPINGVYGFYKYNSWSGEWYELKRMPKDWNSRYKPIGLLKKAKADTEG
ncbi:hypothetical protein [Acinetobacter haemolyticus]|uniref:hypothetical protein n=1 Tax=Acinetobacter haemolyticus TaxID=29430 RepID=UPI003F54C0F4